MTDVITTKLIKQHEGLRLETYPCTKGVWTIGYGHTKDVKPGDKITLEQAERLFNADLSQTVYEVFTAFPWAHEISHNRQAVLIDMCFNLGITKLKQFKVTIALAKTGHYKMASVAMLNSKWAKQVGQRAKTLSELMRNG